MGTVALPYYRWSLAAAMPIPGYPEALEHVGHHLLKRRLDLRLQQKTAAKQLGTDGWNLRNWETGRHPVAIRFYPAIIAFLGYNPLPEAQTRGERLRRERICRGWSRKELANRLRIDEATVRRIEDETPRLGRRPLEALCRLFDIEPS